MKYGIECEGMLKGLPTVFCEAFEIDRAAAYARGKGITHVYVSDRQNDLDYDQVGATLQGLQVTLEVTAAKGNRPDNVALMLNCNRTFSAYVQVSQLAAKDQIKFEHNRNVIVLPMSEAIFTEPKDFDGDIEI